MPFEKVPTSFIYVDDDGQHFSCEPVAEKHLLLRNNNGNSYIVIPKAEIDDFCDWLKEQGELHDD